VFFSPLASRHVVLQDPIEFPVITQNIPRQLPDQPWYLNPFLTALLGGVLPFGACFVELFFIMSSIWMDQYYYVFGFLLLVYIILAVTCAEITIVLNYFQLCSEDYRSVDRETMCIYMPPELRGVYVELSFKLLRFTDLKVTIVTYVVMMCDHVLFVYAACAGK
jgi:transmembrane 9 superfamily member 2/4